MITEKNLTELQELAEAGIKVELAGANSFRVYGFYKSGDALIDFNAMSITTRYDTIRLFEEDDELLRIITWLNYDWWDRSKDRHDGWKEPDANWARFYEKFNILS